MLEPTDLDDRNNEELGWGRERRLVVNGILCKRRWALAVVEGEARPRCVHSGHVGAAVQVRVVERTAIARM